MVNLCPTDDRLSATSGDAVREALEDLQKAEAEYRGVHDLHGDGSPKTGRAWDLMRRAGDRARAALAPAENVGDESICPPPMWKENDGSHRHPQTLAEWDWRADAAPDAFERSLRRLIVAGDYADSRAPDQMALVLRIDLLRLIGGWTHKNAYFQMMKERREAATPTPPSWDVGRKRTIEECADVCDRHSQWAEDKIKDDTTRSKIFAAISNTADDCASMIRDLLIDKGNPVIISHVEMDEIEGSAIAGQPIQSAAHGGGTEGGEA